MATKAINADIGSEVKENKGSAWGPFIDLLTSVVEVVEMYFGALGSIASMNADHRTNLTARGKTDGDADLMGLR